MDDIDSKSTGGLSGFFTIGCVLLGLGLLLNRHKGNRMNGLTIAGIVLLSISVVLGFLVCCCACGAALAEISISSPSRFRYN